MNAPPRVAHAHELLDQPQANPRQLEQSLVHVAQVNRWLGGNRSVIKAIASSSPATALELLDIGTGSAALPRRIVRWARRKGLAIRVRATDVHAQTLDYARRACRDYPEIVVEEANALHLPYPDMSFTHALLTLTLHHFEGNQQTAVLRELSRVCRNAAIVSELERCWPNYFGARLLAATWWRKNPITRHDGPLSVLRAFTSDELIEMTRAAGLEAHVQSAFFYRLVMVLLPDRRAASATD